ncbi:hypothetical protein D3C87_1945010 [compost metagenome]
MGARVGRAHERRGHMHTRGRVRVRALAAKIAGNREAAQSEPAKPVREPETADQSAFPFQLP